MRPHVKSSFKSDFLDRESAGSNRDRAAILKEENVRAINPCGRTGWQRNLGPEQAPIHKPDPAFVLIVEARILLQANNSAPPDVVVSTKS